MISRTVTEFSIILTAVNMMASGLMAKCMDTELNIFPTAINTMASGVMAKCTDMER